MAFIEPPGSCWSNSRRRSCRGVLINGKGLGRRVLTRGSPRGGRSGWTMKAAQGVLALGAPSQRRASRQLIRATPMCWSLADGPITRRTRLSTMATLVSSCTPLGTVWPCTTSIGSVVVSCASAVSTCQRWRDQRGQVGHMVDRRVEERGHTHARTGPAARRAEAIPPRSAHHGRGQGGQRLAAKPGGTGLR